MPEIIMHTSDPKAQEQTLQLELNSLGFVVGVLRDEQYSGKVMLTPKAVNELVDNGVVVLLECGVGKDIYADWEYADAGGDLMDCKVELLSRVNVVLKLSPLSTDELSYLKKQAVVLSCFSLSQMDSEDLQLMRQKRLTMVALEKMTDKCEQPVFKALLESKKCGHEAAVMISELLLPLLKVFISSRNVRFAVQTYPALINGIYCFMGEICFQSIAEKFQCPWKDILSLCWNWN